MSIPEAFVDVFRTIRADRYIDSCVVSRVTGTAFNETTGQTEATTEVVYAGECLVRPASANESDFGEARRQLVDYDLYLPFDADDRDQRRCSRHVWTRPRHPRAVGPPWVRGLLFDA
jgi:hypothetical protein